MATNHTTNYNLNLWEPNDKFVREEFNENTQKIDAALATQLRIHTGAYVGNGQPEQLIELPFRPVFFWLQKGQLDDVRLMLFGGLNTVLSAPSGGTNSYQRCNTNGQGAQITWEDSGLKIYGGSYASQEFLMYAMNEKNIPYFYVAIG